jgi:hypothetical protein
MKIVPEIPTTSPAATPEIPTPAVPEVSVLKPPATEKSTRTAVPTTCSGRTVRKPKYLGDYVR